MRRLEADRALKVVVLHGADPDTFIDRADVNANTQLPGTPPAREDRIFLEAARSASARRRIAAAPAIAMQTATIEKGRFCHAWEQLAEH